ncbi:MAG: LapA family protein [Betaproteobacteria bacterium]|nr:MAG: LapA family protein [Betaproteobacteria bacterium]
MRYVLWLLRIVLFLLLLGFAVKNSDPVTVYYYFGAEWRAPMVFVLLICLCAGVVLGVLAALGQVFRQRREIADLKRELRAGARTGIHTVTPSTDAS